MRASAGVAPDRDRLFVTVAGRRLAVLAAGPEDGRLLLLLHGFPEGASAWKHQIDAFARSGFRVWAPDQCGYGMSDRPPDIASYRLDRLGADALGLIDAAGRDTADVVGHDWGGAVAWWIAGAAPERVSRLVVLNCPHPDVLRRALLTQPRQMLRSWYMAFFQLPWLPEKVASAGGHRLLVWGLRSSSRPGTFTDADLAAYREDWGRPGALRSMIHWYRALRLRVPRPAVPMGAVRGGDAGVGAGDAGGREQGRITQPSLLIWGVLDRALGRELAAPSLARCDRGRIEFLEQATHWLQHEEPDRVNALILEHLRSERGGDPPPAG
ncbi:MAG: alpha/beta fold hydrolase [Planctomycetota bacterium]